MTDAEYQNEILNLRGALYAQQEAYRVIAGDCRDLRAELDTLKMRVRETGRLHTCLVSDGVYSCSFCNLMRDCGEAKP